MASTTTDVYAVYSHSFFYIQRFRVPPLHEYLAELIHLYRERQLGNYYNNCNNITFSLTLHRNLEETYSSVKAGVHVCAVFAIFFQLFSGPI